MKTRCSTDSIAWIIAVIAAVITQRVTTELAIQLTPTLLACVIAGVFWIALRAVSWRLSRRTDARWVSAALSMASVMGAGILALLVIVALDIDAARGVVAAALALAGIGWGLISEFLLPRSDVQIA